MANTCRGRAALFLPDDRWSRLERYARFRSGRLRLHLLPNDVLLLLVEFLTAPDLQAFLTAVVGVFPLPWRSDHTLLVPAPMRRRWLVDASRAVLEAQLHALAAQALFYGREHTSALVAADWSPFSGKPFVALAEYFWRRQHPVAAHVLVDSACVATVTEECLRRGATSVCLTVHLKLVWGSASIVNPTPVLRQLLHILPPHAPACLRLP